MAYFIDDEHVSLEDLQKRIEETDLVPSRTPLLDGIEKKISVLKQQGIRKLCHLRNELKTPKRLEALAKATALDTEYLTLLRREIESYFPKPPALKEFAWLPENVIEKLEGEGVRDAAEFYHLAESSEQLKTLSAATGVEAALLENLLQLVDLTRVQWVSPTAARMLAEAGICSSSELAAADASELYEAFNHINAAGRYFKGKIGLRDVKRLVHAACYVSKPASE